jgi:hypothetical protein
MSAIGSLNNAVVASLLKTTSDGVEGMAVGATLLKQATNMDKSLVQELLPEPPHNGRVNIRA